jgi:hypothetical protein
MNAIQVNGTAARSPPPTANRLADFGGAIRNARVALKSGAIDGAIVPAFETIDLVALCLREFS